MYTFDGENRLIILDSGVTEFDSQDLYSRWKEWVILSDNAKWIQAMSPVGGEVISAGATGGVSFGSTQFVSAYIILINGWKIRPQEANHQLNVIGNLITDDGSDPFVDTLGSFNVRIRNQVTSNSITTVVEAVTGSGGFGSCEILEADVNSFVFEAGVKSAELASDITNILDSDIVSGELSSDLDLILEASIGC